MLKQITLLSQKQLIYARPYSPPDTARLRICTTLSWPVYSSSQYAGPYSPPHTAIQLVRDLPCLGTWIARTIELNRGTSHSHATCTDDVQFDELFESHEKSNGWGVTYMSQEN